MKPTPNQIICADNLKAVSDWPDNCIDGIVTDPPYGLGFMGKEWDTFTPEYIEKKMKREKSRPPRKDGKPRLQQSWEAGSYDLSRNAEFQQWFTIWAKAMLRICKPGAFLLCFGGTRTFHRLTCAIEDAGWEIRDCMMWLYGSGFPKSHNISKAIDKIAGVKRKVIGIKAVPGYAKSEVEHGKQNRSKYEFEQTSDKPITNLAQLWNGYGTALKPAWEPIIVAMKPLDGTFAANAEMWEVAGLNIDGGRVGTETITQRQKDMTAYHSNRLAGGQHIGKVKQTGITTQTQGRWPANLILDEGAGKMLDEQSGGASRFFYCAKTSRKERNLGLEDCEDKLLARSGGAQSAEKQGSDEYLQKHMGLNRISKVKNNHPTVKPLALMKYLCTLVKMPNQDQIILDPFMGSGTTGMACEELEINFIGIEKELEYCEIAQKRIAAIRGRTLPISKNAETFRTDSGSRVKSTTRVVRPSAPNENPPRNSESRQSIINAASAALREKRK